ncbi:hypothetical protein COMA2_130054 [Candidatus Nitrospira nitrificans]|uniref:Uncharacterized protein n=1 Tax=Candidatus Nitrospira nitrificans TaxID=1742973 RepID=A0A0S4L9G6_9BACT|nr:hypothetical protein COMA2_130054 [Candidatus Nitrospira nitrificans]
MPVGEAVHLDMVVEFFLRQKSSAYGIGK